MLHGSPSSPTTISSVKRLLNPLCSPGFALTFIPKLHSWPVISKLEWIFMSSEEGTTESLNLVCPGHALCTTPSRWPKIRELLGAVLIFSTHFLIDADKNPLSPEIGTQQPNSAVKPWLRICLNQRWCKGAQKETNKHPAFLPSQFQGINILSKDPHYTHKAWSRHSYVNAYPGIGLSTA